MKAIELVGKAFEDQELWKAFLSLGVAVISLLVTWLVGNRVSGYFAERQKRREFELALANTFYTHYGEFRATWLLWNDAWGRLKHDADIFRKTKAEVLDRACRAEGGLEAALLKVASERVLSEQEQADLGKLRQAFQVLRERIEREEPVSYGASEDRHYVEFKRLATLFGVLLASKKSKKQPNTEQAFVAFREITHNKHELHWQNIQADVPSAAAGRGRS